MNGFLLNSTSIFSKKGFFLNHHFNNYIEREDRQFVKAYEVGFCKRTNNLKKVFGEFFEREVLINNSKYNLDYLKLNYMIMNKSKELPTDSLIFVDKFVDSCGMASHTLSQDLIKTAFFEFYERQSFIFNFLSKSEATEYIIDIPKLEKTDKYLKNYVDNIKYYDISLLDNMHVILCLGYGQKKCVGLGTSPDIKTAIEKSQIEALQYFANSFSSNHEFSDQNYEIDDSNDMYHVSFDNLSVEKFCSMYDYLLNNISKFQKISTVKKIDFVYNDFILECSTKLQMNPLIAFFETNHKIPHLKVIKILDENWFPHMNAALFRGHSYDFVSNATGKELDRKIKYIPFP